MQKLDDYILTAYRGNQAAFARDINRTPQHVSQMLRQVKPAYVEVTESGIRIFDLKMDLTQEKQGDES